MKQIVLGLTLSLFGSASLADYSFVKCETKGFEAHFISEIFQHEGELTGTDRVSAIESFRVYATHQGIDSLPIKTCAVYSDPSAEALENKRSTAIEYIGVIGMQVHLIPGWVAL